MNECRDITVVATAEGTLSGRIARLNIKDARPSLTFMLHIPVLLRMTEAMLSVEVRYPEVRGWQGLRGRNYRFDVSTRMQEKSDGETYVRDDVVSDLRTATGYYDTFVTRVAFGNEAGKHLSVQVEGTVRMDEGLLSFVVDARVQVGGVVVESGIANEALDKLDQDAYQRAGVRDGFVTYDPRFDEEEKREKQMQGDRKLGSPIRREKNNKGI